MLKAGSSLLEAPKPKATQGEDDVPRWAAKLMEKMGVVEDKVDVMNTTVNSA